MKYTAEEVRAQAQKELHNGLYTVTWGMLTAYAGLLERIKADEVAADYPECSGDPSGCPENEGHGCCKPNPPAQTAQVPTRIAPHTQPAERVVEGCARYIDTGNARWDSAAFQAWREGSNPGSHAWIKRIRELLTAAQQADR